MDRLMEQLPVTRLHYLASGGLALLLREDLDRMDEEYFRLYFRYHLATCERADMLGFTSHALDIFQKNG